MFYIKNVRNLEMVVFFIPNFFKIVQLFGGCSFIFKHHILYFLLLFGEICYILHAICKLKQHQRFSN
jgi:hypothetical protein